MYKVPYFEEKDADKVLAFMQAHSFITLIGYDNVYPVATQIPVHIYKDEQGIRLVGHIMKKTDHYEAYAKNENVLALFTGAHTYISASVYENPAVASTWNYISVQAKGKIRLMDKDETRKVIENLTNSYENPSTSPAAFHKMDEEYIERNLKAISGFEILVEEINSLFKLSQNHSAVNQAKIIEHLSESNDQNAIIVAQQMKANC
ncbi:FMN-binding negative transcriptional regulator [Pedobacter boryungensis]|uniref:FMN-binding negative transcriptional regulator n=1 Tax=Pedobacter boryungensis TaxID=869962 RepID=A0ABX2DDC2_9SPHI|nr:FMN-binding negative transcriptional regulator [Pedobacter boryungensis]NQX31807.1 FMN-binding negative transcriptional regulator [Pedobacter boryungensis]